MEEDEVGLGVPGPSDVAAAQLRLQRLQAELQRAFDAGDGTASASLAQAITGLTQRVKRLQTAVEQRAALDSAEQVWLSSQLSKVNDIKGVVEEKRREVEAMQHSILTALTQPQPPTQPQPSTSSSSSSLFSVFSSHHSQRSSSTSSSSSSAPPFAWSALLSRARRVCKECQLTLEQQNLRVDSIDMNEHPATLLLHSSSPSLPPSPSPSLQSIKAVRKEVVTYIQSQLQHVDAFEQHLIALDAFLTFLERAPRPSYAGGGDEGKAEPQPRGAGEGKGSRFSKKSKSAKR